MKTKKIEILRDYSVPRALLKLSLPATLSMFINSLYNIIDTIFIGQNIGSLGISGLSIAFPLQMIALGLGGMFGMGGASVISRLLGAKKKEEANYTLINVILYCLICSAILVTFGLLFLEPILRLFGATDTILPYASEYMKIIFPGFFVFMFGICMNNIIRAEGHATAAMISMLIGAIGNIILDFIFIVVLKKGIAGAATATVIAQSCQALYLILYYASGRSVFSFSFKYLRPSLKNLGNVSAIGISAFIFQASTSLTAMLVNNILGSYGNDILIAVYGIVIKITAFLAMPLVGIRQGLQPLVGYAYGAKRYKRTLSFIKTAIVSMLVYSTVSTSLVLIFAKPLVTIFNNETAFISEGIPIIRIVVSASILTPFSILASGVFMSVGKVRESIFTSLLKQVIAFIPMCYILSIFLGTLGVWLAFPFAETISAMVSAILLLQFSRKLALEKEIN